MVPKRAEKCSNLVKMSFSEFDFRSLLGRFHKRRIASEYLFRFLHQENDRNLRLAVFTLHWKR